MLGGEQISSLDGLRLLTILMVIGYHYLGRCISPQIRETYIRTEESLRQIKLAGSLRLLGVQLFFAISGFVIALTLTRCKNIREFAVRRSRDCGRQWRSV